MKSIHNSFKKLILISFCVVASAVGAMAQQVPGVYVSPNENQSHEQQVNDERSCYSWAENQSMTNPTQQEAPRKHKAGKRAAAGAGAGAIIGGGKGAAIGAGAGAISGRRSHKKDEREAEATMSDDFVRAYSSCLKSKGYSVE